VLLYVLYSDKERGVVWEESIILLPHKVRFVFLSATIPNATEFTGWVSKMHHQVCRVVYTDYRPVPLQHFLFPSGADGLYLVVDEKSVFREENFQKAMGFIQKEDIEDATSSKRPKKVRSKGQNTDLFRIVKLIMERELDPCIVFSFSKKDCETYALQMARFDFTSADEKGLIENVFSNALEALAEEDRKLPQIDTLLPLLKRGIGIHHGGLLPILKEIIEILFQESLIKCLFATETFSIGINMPARTVVFTSTRKFDGQDFRWISSGEYIQMSGRAGRRGKDDKGIVIQMIDEKIEPAVAKGMLYGESDPLVSSYHVTYNMVLNMLRVEDADPENVLKMSFHQYQHEMKTGDYDNRAQELMREAGEVTFENESTLEEYYSLKIQIDDTYDEISKFIRQPDFSVPFLQPGRLVFMQDGATTWGWGALVNFHKKPRMAPNEIIGVSHDGQVPSFVLDILLPVIETGDKSRPFRCFDPYTDDSSKLEPQILHFSLDLLCKISAIRMNLPKSLTSAVEKMKTQKALLEIKRRFEADYSIPLLDPVKDIGIHDAKVVSSFSRYNELVCKLATLELNKNKDKESLLRAYGDKLRLIQESRHYRKISQESRLVLMKDDLRCMTRVLRRLGFVSSENVLEIKGKFACELSTADELLLTEMLFEGVFNSLAPVQIVSLLSCFVHQEKSKEGATTPTPELREPFRVMQSIARTIAKAKVDAKIPCDEEEYVKSFDPSLMVPTYIWASGKSFIEVCKSSEVFEGSLIRSIRRLEELLRQLASAAASIGDTTLRDKFESAANSIRRGVVFAASLYL